jgi:hypothetical protein
MKGEEQATLEKPPNHKLFSADKAPISPILQRRMDSAKNAGTSTAAQAPVFNITIGKEITDLFRPTECLPPPSSALPSGSGSTLGSPFLPHTSHDSPNLLPPSHTPGMDMSLEEFCMLFTLSPSILEKLTNNDYKTAHMLHFVTFAELKEMGFKLGAL